MKILKFKSNINCGECVKTVAPFLGKEESISKWNVDYNDPDRLSSVSGYNVDPQKVKNLIEKAGFKADVVLVSGAGGGEIK